jgi:hypothetical protein
MRQTKCFPPIVFWLPNCRFVIRAVTIHPFPVALQVSLRPIADIEEELRTRRQQAKGGAAYESSDDEEGGVRGQRVQCAQQ